MDVTNDQFIELLLGLTCSFICHQSHDINCYYVVLKSDLETQQLEADLFNKN